MPDVFWANTVPAIIVPTRFVTVVNSVNSACGQPGMITVEGQQYYLIGGSPSIDAAPVFNSGSKAATVWGLGWSSDNDQYIQVSSNGVITWMDGMGTQWSFFRVNSATVTLPAYSQPVNSYMTMTALSVSSGLPTAVSERETDGTTRIFSVAESTAFLRLSSLYDRNGSTVTYSRDGSGRLTSVTDIHGRYFHMTYNGAGYVASTVDSAGRTVSYTYDSSGRRTGENGPAGAIGYQYDYANRLTRITYPNSGMRNYAYDSQNRVTEQDDGNGVDKLTYVYGSSTTQITDALGRTTLYVYTNVQGLSKVTQITDPAGNVTTYAYDSNLNLTSQTDALGRTTHYAYDGNGNVTATQDAAGNYTRATYEPTYNHVTSVTDPLSHTSTMTYDNLGNLTQTKDPLTYTTNMAYDSYGHTTQSQDPLGYSTDYSYDSSNGALASFTDPLSHTTSRTTDALSRLTQNTDPDGKVTQYAYDTASDLTQVTDALSHLTGYSYSPGRTSKFLGTVTDANSHGTSFQYDTVGRVTKVTDALGHQKSFTYDAKGNLTSVKDANGNTTSFSYDTLDRMTQRSMPNGEGNITYTYDAVGNLTQVTHPNGSQITTTYDSLNRVSSVVQQLVSGGPTYTIGYTYDAAGNRTGMSTPWGSFSYTYDADNRLTSITNPQSQVFSFSYDADGRRTEMDYPNGVVTTYTYDAAGRVTEILASTGTTVVALSSYTYDAAGNRTTMTDSTGTHTYSYDDLHRLTSAVHPAGSGLPISSETFTYDSVGNRLSDAAIASYSYNQANELTSNSSYTYTYDANGNLLTKTDTSSNETYYTYNSQNQLTQVALPGGITVIYRYDGQGRRIEKSTGSMASQDVRYIYDGPNILAMLDGNNSLSTLFTNGLGIDQPLEIEVSSVNYYYHADGLGSIIALTNLEAQVTEATRFTSYGQPTIKDALGNPLTQSGIGNPLQFTARLWDPESGLSDFRRRQTYDFQIGRFGQADPIGYLGGIDLYTYADSVGKGPGGLDTQKGSVSTYQYAFNSPTNWSDPSGLDPLWGALYILFGPTTGNPANAPDQGTPTYPPNITDAQLEMLIAMGAAEAAGNTCSLINHNQWLRIGPSTYKGQPVFRIGGDVLKWFMDNPHIDLWPPKFWFK